MLHAAVKSVLARKLRLALTASAIVLGVAFVTGTLVLTDTSSQLFDDQFADATGGVDLVVRRAAAFGAAMGVEVQRDPVAPQALERIRAIDGVAGAEGQVQGQALLVAPDGTAIVPSGPSVGLSWLPEPYNAFVIRSGRPPAADGEVVIDAATAAAHNLAPGDDIAVHLDGTNTAFTVVGTVGFGERDGLPDATVALFDLATAQALFSVNGYSQVVVTTDGVADVVRDRVTSDLGGDYEAQTSQDTAAASAAAAKEQLNMLRLMLLVIAATALLVGAFMIANTFSISVAQRTREFGVLRAIGATGRQILVLVLGEAAAIGLVASGAGAGLGLLAAVALRDLVARFGVELPDGALVVAPRTILIGVAGGTLVTALSAVAAARRAARTTPMEALRDASAARHSTSRARTALGALAAAGAVALAVASATARTPSLAAVAAAALLTVLAFALLGPTVAGRLAGVVGRPLERLGVSGRLARRSARRAPRRTAATTTALALGLAVVTFVTVLGASMKASVTQAMDDVITADLVIESARGEMLGGLSPHVHHRVSDLPEVATVARMRFGHWQRDGAVEALTAVDPATFPAVANINLVAGRLDTLSSGGVVVSHNVARAQGLAVGDRLAMTLPLSGTQHLPVVGILAQEHQWAVRTGYLIALETFAQHFAEDVDAAVFVDGAAGVAPRELRAAVEGALATFPTATVLDHAQAKRARTQSVDELLGLVSVLLLLAIVIALLGITNTLALSVVERTREVGLLRAVGMTRRQVRAMVRWEAVLIAVLGAATGVALGLAFGWTAVQALAGQARMTFTVPSLHLTAYLAVAATAGLLAGLLPARRAARQDVLAAIATQ